MDTGTGSTDWSEWTLELDPPVEVNGPIEVCFMSVHSVLLPSLSFTASFGTFVAVLTEGDGIFESLHTILDGDFATSDELTAGDGKLYSSSSSS